MVVANGLPPERDALQHTMHHTEECQLVGTIPPHSLSNYVCTTCAQLSKHVKVMIIQLPQDHESAVLRYFIVQNDQACVLSVECSRWAVFCTEEWERENKKDEKGVPRSLQCAANTLRALLSRRLTWR